MPICSNIQTADWKAEKHVPAIDCPDAVKAGEMFELKVSLGKAVAPDGKPVDHPNTTEHHIRWIKVFFHPDGDKFTYDVANLEFDAHGESVQGANKGPVYTHHGGALMMRVDRPGTIHAMAMCNIHGLWESERRLALK